jgi:hypothetical protein
MISEWSVGCGVQLSGHGLIVGTTQAFPVVAEGSPKTSVMIAGLHARRWCEAGVLLTRLQHCVTVIILYVFIFTYEVANRKFQNWFAEVAIVDKDRYVKWDLFCNVDMLMLRWRSLISLYSVLYCWRFDFISCMCPLMCFSKSTCKSREIE